MPIFDYHCECGKVEEIIQKTSEEKSVQCPTCGKEMKRQVSAASFQLKGTGWYKTDFADKK